MRKRHDLSHAAPEMSYDTVLLDIPFRALFFGAAGLEPIVGKDCKATGRPRYDREKPLNVFLLAFMEQGYPSLV